MTKCVKLFLRHYTKYPQNDVTAPACFLYLDSTCRKNRHDVPHPCQKERQMLVDPSFPRSFGQASSYRLAIPLHRGSPPGPEAAKIVREAVLSPQRFRSRQKPRLKFPFCKNNRNRQITTCGGSPFQQDRTILGRTTVVPVAIHDNENPASPLQLFGQRS